MLKSTITRRKYLAMYRLLDRVSPLDFDCGKLCGAACCTAERAGDPKDEVSASCSIEPFDSEMGIYLFPGEHKVFQSINTLSDEQASGEWLSWKEEDPEDYDFPESWKGKVYYVNCKGPLMCNRKYRPLQCRTYPLTPHISKEGELSLIYNDWKTPYRCPLIEDEIPLNDDFVQATFTVWKHLILDPLIYDLVKMDSEERERAFDTLADMLL